MLQKRIELHIDFLQSLLRMQHFAPERWSFLQRQTNGKYINHNQIGQPRRDWRVGVRFKG